MNIEQLIIDGVRRGVESLWHADVDASQVQIQKTRKDYEGHLTVVTFPLTRVAHQSPEQVGQALGAWLRENLPDVVGGWNAVKGFLNLVVSREAWLRLLDYMDGQERWGCTAPAETSPLVMIEYSSPNTNKPLHLGHVRNNLLGWSLSRIMEANGNRVVKTNIVNDRGIHICKSMLAWLKWGNGATPESTGKKGDHLIGDFYVLFDKHYRAEWESLAEQYEMQDGMPHEEAQEKAKQDAPLIKEAHQMLVRWEQGDPQVRTLWRTMNSWVYAGFDETYRRLGVAFDKIYYESDTYLVGREQVLDGLGKGLFVRKDDGSVWADLRADGLDEKILLRSDGTSVYMTQDIGTAKLRFEDFPIDRMIYVVGNEQNYHFQVLSLLLDRLGFKWGKSLVHFSYGMVELPNGKMKSREGTVVDADELMDEMERKALAVSQEMTKKIQLPEEEAREVARKVGMGALKYFILKIDARKNMLFNPDESIDFNGNTGPFIQYTYARIASILRKAAQGGTTAPATSAGDCALSAKETELIQQLYDFQSTVRQAGAALNPSLVASYCYELAKLFNQFYHDFTILGEPHEPMRQMRLRLSAVVGKVLRTGMDLLGIEMPERM